MAKDTYYFSHDYNARNDKKISALVREYKSSGYGIFWVTAEMLHEEGGEIEFDDLTISAISKDLNEDFDLVKDVIQKCATHFKLFNLSPDNILTANRVKRNLHKRTEISKKRSEAGKASANAKQMQTNVEQMSTKERKGKEIKESKEIIKDNRHWFLKYYHSNYESYKAAFNGQSTTEFYFNEWKSFIDFIYDKKYHEILDCKFITPHDYATIVKNNDFNKNIWDDTLKKILSTGVKPEHNLFFRIPEFMGFKKNQHKKDSNGKTLLVL